MRKRGQFYLITTILIISVIAGLILVTNYSQKKSNVDLDYLREELILESEKVIDHGLNNNKDMKGLLTDFTTKYPNYSPADDFYFLFGNKDIMTIAGFKKLTSGSITANIKGTEELFELTQGYYNSKDFSNPSENMIIKVDEIQYSFDLNPGENLILSSI